MVSVRGILLFLLSALLGCGSGASSSDEGFDLPFTPDTPLTVSTIEAYGGALELVLSPTGTPCGTREERKSFDQQSTIRIAMVAVDQAGELTLVDEPWTSAEETAVPAINGFAAFFVPGSTESLDLEQAHLNALRGTGTLSLDVVPNYDTGRTLGR